MNYIYIYIHIHTHTHTHTHSIHPHSHRYIFGWDNTNCKKILNLPSTVSDTAVVILKLHL